MKCIIPGINLKVFGRAIHSLAKIGDEVYFEPLEQGLSLRTVNSSRSAYACFLFFPSYFQHYDDGRKQAADTSGSEEDEEEGLRCKITMKSVMAVFRSLSTIEKTVEKCRITHNAKEARLVFELHCRHGIVKKHNLAYIECETLQAIFSKDLCPNKLTAPSKLFCEVVVNFQTTQEEVTLAVRPEVLSLKNYVEDEPDPNKVVHTELSLAPEEFDQYQVGVDTDITFCLKELRAILAFGETTGQQLSINFEEAGRPVTFCIDSDQTFEANFVLATLAEAEQTSSQMPASQRGQQSASHSQKNSVPSGSKHGDNRGKSSTLKNGGIAAPRKNAEPENAKNGPSSSSREAACEEEDAMGDISAEDLALAMEVEQEWERAERGRLPPPSSPPTDRTTDRTDTSSQNQESVKQTHEHVEKRPRSSENEGQSHQKARFEKRPRLSENQESVKQTHTHFEKGSSEKQGQSHQHRKDGGKGRHGEISKETLPQGRECERERPSHGRRGLQPQRSTERAERLGGGVRQQMLQGDGGEEEGGVSASPVIPVQCPAADETREGPCLQPLSEDEDLDDTVPGTPPSTPPAKKFRSLFFGSSQKSTGHPQNKTVLAADTDEED